MNHGLLDLWQYMPVTQEQFDLVRKEVSKSRFARRNYTAPNPGWKHLIYRVYRPFLKLKYRSFRNKNPDLPWLNPDAINALKLLLEPEMIGYEYGSGISTIFFSGLLKHIHSLEHNQEWYDRIKKTIAQKEIDNATLLLKTADKEFQQPTLSSIEQLNLTPTEYPVQDSYFKTYSQQINTFQDESLDFVMVDGRARVCCAQNALPKLKKGGLIVLDNSERVRYKDVHQILADWPKIWTTSGLSDTTIWLKQLKESSDER